MTSCDDLFRFLREHRVSAENANEAERIMRAYAKDRVEEECKRVRAECGQVIAKLSQRIKKLSTPSDGFAEMIANSIQSNPELFAKVIGPIIKDHLSLDSKSEEYSGYYANLTWDKDDLGSICIDHYSDD